ncbi:MAG: hypothetical protein KAJ63_06605 [Methyloprofundus sp.]|nr:hypothetical protein [Methyloprofundus sp.]
MNSHNIYSLLFAIIALFFTQAVKSETLLANQCAHIPPAADAPQPTCANTYFIANGFDENNDGLTDYIKLGNQDLPAVETEKNKSGLYLQSSLGGITAPMAYFPMVEEVLTGTGLETLKGGSTFTFQEPQDGSALGYRSVLYATSGSGALKAFYTDAIREFTPALSSLLDAEEDFRTALRVNPFYEDALNGLLETYYARAEGFMLIGNDYMAKAFRQKFDRLPQETRSIVELEVANIDSALQSYEVGFREFMKLFNQDNFMGVGQISKPFLNIDPEYLFFTRRFQNPDSSSSEQVAFESLRGQANSIGHATNMYEAAGVAILPVQGSPSFSSSARSSQGGQLTGVDAPIKFKLPIVEAGSVFEPGKSFTLRFEADIDSNVSVQELELLVEFDPGLVSPPTTIDDIDFSLSDFSPIVKELYSPGSVYKGKQLFGNQLLIRIEADTQLTGLDQRIAAIPFIIKGDAVSPVDDISIYVAGSGGSLVSGFKDIAILYRLAAAHANATFEKVSRLYSVSSPEASIALIEEEVERIGGWFDHIQALLLKSANAEDLANIDPLQSAIRSISSELNALSSLRGFIRSGANQFGYPNDYLPFYNTNEGDTFSAIRSIAVGSGTIGSFTPRTAGGIFGIAREAETNATQLFDKLENTKDRIRNELFTINQQAENRLVQICGRVDSSTGEPSLNVSEPIDYDLRAAPRNIASEIGQHVLLFSRASAVLEQSQADIEQLLKAIELEKVFLQNALQLHDKKTQVIQEYSVMQQNLDRELGKIAAKQARLRATAEALKSLTSGATVDKWFTGGSAASIASAAITVANGMMQARLEEKRGSLQADKTRLASEERIALTQIDTEIFQLQQQKNIENMVNQIAVKQIAAEIAEIDVQVALGKLNQLITERDNLLAQKGRSLANLGEMSFADPSFRLTQFGVMKEAENQLEYLKNWLYLMTRALYYKWALQDDYVIRLSGNTSLPAVSIDDIRRIQAVGALDIGGISSNVLGDSLTAAKYAQVLLAFDDEAPITLNLSQTPPITRINSNNTARFSLREDFLHIVRTANTAEENARVRNAFQAWLAAPERRDADNNLVINFDTISHLENYNQVVNPQTISDHGTWTHFALRSFSTKPLWNHKITQVGVSLRAFGSAFTAGNNSVSGSLEYGGTGFVKGNSVADGDFSTYQMRQWRKVGLDGLEPIDFRTVALPAIPNSNEFEASEATYLHINLKERPVAASSWRLFIPASQVNNIELNNIEDIFIYIYSTAYQQQ